MRNPLRTQLVSLLYVKLFTVSLKVFTDKTSKSLDCILIAKINHCVAQSIIREKDTARL